jgi:GT2 family glycosyltransferase
MPKAYIIIVNYNNWKDTLECLESVYRSQYGDYTVVVVDNHSTDRSVEKILQWAAGSLPLPQGQRPGCIESLVFPEVGKPLPVKYIKQASLKKTDGVYASHTLVLIEAKSNKGFAAGNNLGLKYALKDKNAAFFWLLNNDTVVEPTALARQIEAYMGLRLHTKTGVLGSRLMHYYEPHKIQYAGGAVYKPWTGNIKPLTSGDELPLEGSSNTALFYVAGASMFVDRQFVKEVGLLEEAYFLYYEELDWTMRARQKGYSSAYAPESVIYHKEGATISGQINKGPASKSPLADVCSLRSKLLFTRKFFPQCLPIIYLSFGLTFANRIRRKQAGRIPMLWRVLLSPAKSVKANLLQKDKA